MSDNKVKVPISELKFTFSRSSGAGGQNVNKLNSKVTMTWEIQENTSFSFSHKKRFRETYKRFVFEDVVIIHSQKYRSQSRNRQDCIEKLEHLLSLVLNPPKLRRKTKPSMSSVKKRLDSKTKHSMQKKLRSEKF